MARGWWRFGILALVGAVVAGCTGLSRHNPHLMTPGKRQEKVRELAEDYGQSLRWGKLDRAAALVEPHLRDAFLRRFTDEVTPYQFTSFQLVAVEPTADAAELHARVEFQMYRPPSLSEETVRELQSWRYDPGSQRWFVTPEFRRFDGRRRVRPGGVSAGGR